MRGIFKGLKANKNYYYSNTDAERIRQFEMKKFNQISECHDAPCRVLHKNVPPGTYTLQCTECNEDCEGKRDEELNTSISGELKECTHENVRTDGIYFYCKDCGASSKDAVADLALEEGKKLSESIDRKNGFLPEKEIVICSAVKTTSGQIFRGHRHADCFAAISPCRLNHFRFAE